MALLAEQDKLDAGRAWRDKLGVDRVPLGTITKAQIISFLGDADAALNTMELTLFGGLPGAIAPWAATHQTELRDLLVELQKKRKETL